MSQQQQQPMSVDIEESKNTPLTSTEPRSETSLLHNNKKRALETCSSTELSRSAQPTAKSALNKKPSNSTQLTDHEKISWVKQIETALPERPRSDSVKAILETAASQFSIAEALVLANTGITLANIKPYSLPSHFEISAMTPEKWKSLDELLAETNGTINGTDVQAFPPKDYSEWADHSLVVYLPKHLEEPLTKPQAVALNLKIHQGMPHPWRILRMYTENEKGQKVRKTEMVRLVYQKKEDCDHCDRQFRAKKIYYQKESCAIKKYHTPGLKAPRKANPNNPLRRNHDDSANT
jgi:hypothetical protein